MINRIINSLKKRRAIGKKRLYKIGKYEIALPAGHMLDSYQQNFKNYDRKLPVIAQLIERKYNSMSIVDIGANIGDTAFALREVCNAALICIEGNPNFLPLLEANLSKLPGTNRVVSKFIGTETNQDLGRLITVNGTAHIEREVSLGFDVRAEKFSVVTYKEILTSNYDLPEVRLVKIDTDGFDFKIVMGLIDQIAISHPILFMEFDPSFSPKKEKFEALDAMNALIVVGYANFVIYDNFGNYIFSISESASDRFKDLFCYLDQSRNNGGGVVYLDICCFAEKDKDIFIKLVDAERANILSPSGI